jgi:hypothetical protein
MTAEKEAKPEAHDKVNWTKFKQAIGGSVLDDWNTIIANQAMQALCLFDITDADKIKEHRFAALSASIGIKPRDTLEGMLAGNWSPATMPQWSAIAVP